MDLVKQFEVRGTPTTLLFSPDGKEKHRFVGFQAPEEYLRSWRKPPEGAARRDGQDFWEDATAAMVTEARRRGQERAQTWRGNLSVDRVKKFQTQIYQHYRAHKRAMPWRQTHNPYHILVSEIMLQQTPVERVLGKYGEFWPGSRISTPWPKLPGRRCWRCGRVWGITGGPWP